MHMFIELHLLQNFAPSNLNRDDTGSPKDCTFGGFRRARISSQCLKRAIRSHFSERNLVTSGDLAVRSKRIADQIAEKLVAAGTKPEDAMVAARGVLTAAGIGFKDDKSQYLVYFGNDEIAALVAICGKHLPALLASAKPEDKPADEQNGKKSKKAAKKDAKDAVGKEVQEEVAAAIGSGRAVDLALFGRMLADIPEKNVEAACQVAHAISVNEVEMEMDFYTAVDDLRPEDTQGADMMGMIEFNSSCFYRYAKLDLAQLAKNLGDPAKVRGAARAFVQSAIEAIPTGKQNSMAAHNPPSYVRVLVREGGEAWNLANAFLGPVRVARRSDGDLVKLAIDKLEAHFAALRRMYGGADPANDWKASLLEADSLSVPAILENLDRTLSESRQ